MSNIKDLLPVTDQDVAIARNYYQKSESDMQQDVAILKEWLRQQPHLPDDEEDRRLERLFLKNKCKLEQTKKKLDKYYSFKVFYPLMLDMYDINSQSILNARKAFIFVPMPNLTDKQERISCFKLLDADAFRGFDGVTYFLMMMELCNSYDYALADICIIDWGAFTLSAMKSIDGNLFQKFTMILSDALSARYSTIQFTNAPVFLDVFLQMAKTFGSPKIFNKIKCTSSIEAVYEYVPKKFLPIEYGGLQKSLYLLHEEWGKELQCQADLLMKISKRTSNEQLRIGKLAESDLFGIDGSFKKLNLD